MKKIKLNSAKLILKKEIIGNLNNSEMTNIVGGGETGYGMCTNFTQHGYTCNGEDSKNCVTGNPGCPNTIEYTKKAECITLYC